MGFWSSFVRKKAEAAVDAVEMAVFTWDPEAATDAELDAAEEQLAQDVRLRAEFKTELEREERELAEATQARDAGVTLLAQLRADYEIAKGNKKEELLAQATAVAAELEELDARVEREAADVPPAKQLFEQMDAIVEENQGKLKAAYEMRDRLINEKKMADRERERADEMAKRQARLKRAGNRAGAGGALSRLQAATAEAKAEAAHTKEMAGRLQAARGGGQSAIERIAAARASDAAVAKAKDPFARLGSSAA
jgi:hypothetical protein